MKADQDNISGMRVAPFHYGSHYSNSGSVLHFLVRLPPYTKMFLNFQGKNLNIILSKLRIQFLLKLNIEFLFKKLFF